MRPVGATLGAEQRLTGRHDDMAEEPVGKSRRVLGRVGAVALAVAALAGVLAPSPVGAIGVRQPTFAGDGRLEAAGAPYVDGAGRILLVERDASSDPVVHRVTRYLSSGVLDTSYGTGGTVAVVAPSNDWAPSIEAAPDGALVFAGADGREIAVLQVSPSGEPDPAFGDQGWSRAECCPNASLAAQLTVLDLHLAGIGGDPVVLAESTWTSSTVQRRSALVRWSSTGVASLPDRLYSAGRPVLLAGGAEQGITVASITGGAGARQTILTRRRANLSPDDEFGDGGTVPMGGAVQALAFDGDRLWVDLQRNATTGPPAELRMVHAGGWYVESFGNGGVHRWGVRPPSSPTDPQTSSTAASALLPAADGGVVVVAATTRCDSFAETCSASTSGTEVAHLSATGSQVGDKVSDPTGALVGASMAPAGDALVLARTVDGAPAVERYPVASPGTVLPAPSAPVHGGTLGLQISLSWTAPSAPGARPPLSYVVRGMTPGVAEPVVEVEVSGTRAEITVPRSGVVRFTVAARNRVGLSPASAPSAVLVAPYGSVDRFVGQLAEDFGGRSPGPSEVSATRSALASGVKTPDQVVADAADHPTWRAQHDPVARLYRSYFGRTADTSGLRYWVEQRRRGVTVARISSNFAGSSEFVRQYGSLANAAFVQLVYENVLGRPPDPVGAAYWVGRLDRRVTSRGQLMANFSESTEHVALRKVEVDIVGLHYGMLRRAPTAAELQGAQSLTRTELAGRLIDHREHRRRLL